METPFSPLRILKAGEAKLYQKSHSLTFPLTKIDADDIGRLVATHRASGGLALAAPQVAILKKMIVMEIPEQSPHPRYDFSQDQDHKAFPFAVMVNPEFKPVSKETQIGFESCLSYPGYRGKVERFTHILISWQCQEGQPHQQELKGFNARVFQHEYDHLDGITYVQRIKDLSSFEYLGQE